MRRIELAPGQVFEEKMLNRVGAFNADALVAATNIVEDVRKRGDEALREYTAKFDGVEMEEFVFRRKPSMKLSPRSIRK